MRRLAPSALLALLVAGCAVAGPPPAPAVAPTAAPTPAPTATPTPSPTPTATPKATPTPTPEAPLAAFRRLAADPPPIAAPTPPPDEPLEPVSAPAPPLSAMPWVGPAPIPAAAETAAWERLEAARTGRLVAAAATDPLVLAALAAWPDLADAERLQAATRLAALEGRVFRFTPAPMTVSEELVETDEDEDFGAYDDEDTRAIELAAFVIARDDPRDFLDTVVHEQLHAYQHQKEHDAATGRLPADHPLAPEARAWHFNAEHYTAFEDGEAAYAAQPVEAHAFATAARVLEGLGLGGRSGED